MRRPTTCLSHHPPCSLAHRPVLPGPACAQIAAPYMNGHIMDIDIKNGRPSFVKYMTMGRASWELA